MHQHQLIVTLGEYSTAGAKEQNQDFHGAIQPLGPELVSKGIVVALADGISTSRRGAEAAQIAVNSFLDDYYSAADGWTARRAAISVINATNSWMYAQNAANRPFEEGTDREKAGLICTFSALVLKGRKGYIFHVGDGQIARLGPQNIDLLTQPHRISLGGGKSYLGRALGVNPFVEVEYAEVTLQENDLYLLSTDGVHEFLSEDEIRATIDSATDLDAAARSLTERAATNGSGDNLTVQLVRVETLPSGELDDLFGADLRLPPAPMLRSGEEFEGYLIDELIHSGSRSHVWLARDLVDEAPVVLKVLSTERSDDASAISELMLEEWVMRRFAHSNLISAAPERQPRKHLYSVSMFVAGTSLQDWMRAHPHPTLTEVRNILTQLSTGLEAMHRRGVIHRDLRPQNIIIDGAGHVTIIDFGSAQIAGLDEAVPRKFEDGAFAGTVQYSAPELYLGHSASERSDVFSLAVIGYQMLTGELPYGSRVSAANTTAAQRRLKYRSARELNPDIPDWVDAALAYALVIDPARRCGSPAEMIGNLISPDSSLMRHLPKPVLQRGSKRTWQTIAALLAIALVISVVTRPDFN